MSTPIKNNLLVRDVMMSSDKIAVVEERTILKEALEEMNRTRLGIACIVSPDNKLMGILTDGDFRRKLIKIQKPFAAFLVDDAIDHAIRSPTTIGPKGTLLEAVEIMEQKQIWDLPVISDEGTLLGLLHLHPAVQALLEMA
jgi:CBS domain-containing protein